jgi:hypothetical protein
MTKDFIHDDDWNEETVSRPAAVTKTAGKEQSTLKDYVLIILIAIIAVMGINNYLYARTGGPGLGGVLGGGGGCCGAGGGAAGQTVDLEQLGLVYYQEATGDENMEDVRASVQDFGCHQEVYIYKGDQQVMRLSYAGGQMYQL